MKTSYAIILFCISFILVYLNDIIEARKKISRISKAVIAFLVSMALSISGSVLFEYTKGIWIEESFASGILRGTVPYFVETNKQYGNFCIELESQGELSEQGFQIAIKYVNSKYAQIIVWDYSEPVWFNIEPMEYEFTIMSQDGTYDETYSCRISEEGDTYLTLPIY